MWGCEFLFVCGDQSAYSYQHVVRAVVQESLPRHCQIVSKNVLFRMMESTFLREALFTFGTFTAELRKSVRSVRDATPVTIIITFCYAANEVDDSVLVKYVIFEKFRSDPEKDRC